MFALARQLPLPLSPWSTSALRRLTRGKVSMASIKDLRQRTGAPIKSVKQALEESQGDAELALESLRKLGATLATKRSGRAANEGIISLTVNEAATKGAIIELCCETDFVARTEQFQTLAHDLATHALTEQCTDVARAMSLNEERFHTVTTALGEKIELRRVALVQHEGTRLYKYIHRPASEHCGNIGVLVALKNNAQEELSDIGDRIAMHIAAAHPRYLCVEKVPQEDVERERKILLEISVQQAGNDSKPDHVLQRIVDGRLHKWYGDVVLEQQEMLVEPPDYSGKARTVKKSLAASDPNCTIADFLRFEVGNN